VKNEIDSQLKDFFREEVEHRKEPEIHYRNSFFKRPFVLVISRSMFAAAAILAFCVTAVLRPEKPLDTLINPVQVEHAVGGILQQGSLLMQAYLSKKK